MRFTTTILILYLLEFSHGSADISWATRVIDFSSQRSIEGSPGQFEVNQILGYPSSFPEHGENPCSWSPKFANNKAGEWVILEFNKPIKARKLIVNQLTNTGTIELIKLYDTLGSEYKIYDPGTLKFAEKEGELLEFKIELTKEPVNKIYLKIKTDLMPGFELIDAVGISNETKPYKIEINADESIEFASEPVNLGRNVNTEYHEIAPLISPDGRTLYFVRSGHPRNIGDRIKQDIWYSRIDSNGNFSIARNIGNPINNGWNNAILSLTPDGQKMLLLSDYNHGRPKIGVSISKRTKDGWSYPIGLNIKNLNTTYHIADYVLSNTGKTMILTIKRPDSFGGRDIYVSFLNKDSTWSEPRNIGAQVNTAADEIGAFLASDDRTIYFSTSGYPGYGYVDLFKTERLDSSWFNWSKPINLGPKINTAGWDAYYTIPASGEKAYYVSYENTYGESDIFSIELPEKYQPQPVVLIEGKVFDEETNEPISAEIIYEDLETGEEIGTATTDPETGEYSIVLPTGKRYGYRAKSEGTLSISANLDLRELDNYKEIKSDLKLIPFKKEKVIKLNNIFFDTDKYVLNKESFAELDRLAMTLNDNPDLEIKIQGHTDNIGSKSYNLELSENRAKSVYQYLINAGVNKRRLDFEGYGESKPVATNETEDGRQENRRVEFLIIDI